MLIDTAHDRIEVRIFTLCDHATVPPDGKIYMHGAGINQMFLAQMPGPLRALFLVVRLSISGRLGRTRIGRLSSMRRTTSLFQGYGPK